MEICTCVCVRETEKDRETGRWGGVRGREGETEKEGQTVGDRGESCVLLERYKWKKKIHVSCVPHNAIVQWEWQRWCSQSFQSTHSSFHNLISFIWKRNIFLATSLGPSHWFMNIRWRTSWIFSWPPSVIFSVISILRNIKQIVLMGHIITLIYHTGGTPSAYHTHTEN